ncbi:hypothetical protein [Microbacterium sp. 18062]|uniref:hypothetical protein n=1 Tax=Microbacterium sp. 18062 TaxID=2681410 RepID=UPI00135BBAA0|nr:hypothetical protein [Microbacterium sp. 18062]
MPGAIDDELAVLRARAYGPDADIQSDPWALARLRELEEALRPSDPDGAQTSGGADDLFAEWFGGFATVSDPHDGRRMRRTRADADALLAHDAEPVPTSAGDQTAQEGAAPGRSRTSIGWQLAQAVGVVSDDLAAERTADASDRQTQSASGSRIASAPGSPATPDAPEPSDASEASATAASPGSAASAPEPVSALPAPALSRRARVAWVLSIVVAIVVAAGLTAWTFPFGVRDEHHHDARLTLQSAEIAPSVATRFGVATEDTRYWGEYLGLHIYGTTECLYAVFSEESASYLGGGCAGSGLAPLMDVYIPGESERVSYTSDMEYPEELIRTFPEGGIIRFVLQDDDVVVDVGEFPGRG